MADAVSTVAPVIDADKRALLSAAATGGSAGVQAYKDAQSALGAERQAAAGRAANLAALIGGPEAQGLGQMSDQYYGRGIANLSQAQGTFSADMARRSQAFGDFLDKAKAAIPAYQAQTARIVALKQAAANAAAAKAAKNKLPTSSDILNTAENISSLYPDSTLAGTVGPNGRTETGSLPARDPQRNDVTDDMMMTAADLAAYKHGDKTTEADVQYELANMIAAKKGLTPDQAAARITPSNTATAVTKATKATAPAATPDEKWLTSNVRGVDSKAAKAIMAAPEFKMASDSASQIGNAEVDENGLITSDGAKALGDSSYASLTPRQAFERWMRAQPGTLTMKNALVQYYGGYLSSMGKK